MGPGKYRQYVYRLTAERPVRAGGNKALNLQRLLSQGVRIPRTHVVSWEAYDHYVQDQVPMVAELQRQVAAAVDPARTYAVRSSANIEDMLDHSFAGQFNTVLDVQGVPAILLAIWSIWATAQANGVQAYLNALTAEQRELRMAVIVQEMVMPRVSGVSFSRNPLSGADEILVEAVEGRGTALVQDGVTPLRWVQAAGQWTSVPDDPPFSPGVIEEVAQQTRRIAATFNANVDLEWVFDGNHLTWVQMREISALRQLTVYSNRIAREVLPGMIKPLIWSTNIPLVNAVWIALLTELVGDIGLKIDDLARSFHYRAYFNVSALGRIWEALGLPQESLEIVMGVLPQPPERRRFRPTRQMIRLAPRLLRFAGQKWRLGPRFEQELPALTARIERYAWRAAPELDEAALLAEIDRLTADMQRIVYFNVTVPILMRLYDMLLGRILTRAGVDPASFDLMAGMREHLSYAPEQFLGDLQQALARLDPARRAQIRAAGYAAFEQLPGLADLQAQVADFLRRFGHLSDSGNDFSAVPWREQPELVLKLIAQEPVRGEPSAAKVRFADLRLSPVTGRWARLLYRRARQFRLYREQISSLYTLGYGLFRPYYLALGAHFVARGVLAEPTDIFFLHRDEIQGLVFPTPAASAAPAPGQDFARLTGRRKAEMARCAALQLPTLIYGDVAPLSDPDAETLTGVATSRGHYTGPVKVVRGLRDFDRVQPGDVLVIPYSDVGWTPLFARAGAVVAESGGMLSHSSIVAREYQIPAVVSVAGAMRLQDEMQVTVDGFRGVVLVNRTHERSADAERELNVRGEKEEI